MTISLEELRGIALVLFRHLEETGQTEFVINDDYYWAVPEDTLYDTYEEPKKHTMGQLSDDMDELRQILAGSKEPVGRALVWLAAILKVVGIRSRC